MKAEYSLPFPDGQERVRGPKTRCDSEAAALLGSSHRPLKKTVQGLCRN